MAFRGQLIRINILWLGSAKEGMCEGGVKTFLKV